MFRVHVIFAENSSTKQNSSNYSQHSLIEYNWFKTSAMELDWYSLFILYLYSRMFVKIDRAKLSVCLNLNVNNVERFNFFLFWNYLRFVGFQSLFIKILTVSYGFTCGVQFFANLRNKKWSLYFWSTYYLIIIGIFSEFVKPIWDQSRLTQHKHTDRSK